MAVVLIKRMVFICLVFLSRWLVVCSVSLVMFLLANAVSVYTLIDSGYKIVGTAGVGDSSMRIKALYQKRDSLFVCVLNHVSSRCFPVPK